MILESAIAVGLRLAIFYLEMKVLEPLIKLVERCKSEIAKIQSKAGATYRAPSARKIESKSTNGGDNPAATADNHAKDAVSNGESPGEGARNANDPGYF